MSQKEGWLPKTLCSRRMNCASAYHGPALPVNIWLSNPVSV